MSFHYPFAAIVGQDLLKTALMLCAVNPGIGGVLIRGEKGTAKSTAARGLAQLLPPIDRVRHCAFNCTQDDIAEVCEICRQKDANSESMPVPFVTLPLGATEDRVLGSLDFERALKDAKKAFQPGLLASAHRGILYIDEVNLLADHLVDVLLDVAAMGVNRVQREGLSVSHAARLTLIGTMNQEEGDIRPQLLDRFGLMIDVEAPRDVAQRVEVVRRRIAFEGEPLRFAACWANQQQALRDQLSTAQALLPRVQLDDKFLVLISKLCCELDVMSLRADIVMHKTARTLAALAQRDVVIADDIERAAELALPHRRRRKPFEQPGLNKERLQELMQDANPPPAPQSDDTEPQASNDDSNIPGEGDRQEQVFSAAKPDQIAQIKIKSNAAQNTSGRRSVSLHASRGHYVHAVANENPSHLAVDATLRHAVLRNNGELIVTRQDLHEKVRQGKAGNLILFVVDASGSMAAMERMAAVKSAVLGLLGDAYQRRDQVGVIAFRGAQAEVLLVPTRSVDIAERRLRELPTGGRTPLPHALQLTADTLRRFIKPSGPQPLLVILSDGKANVPLLDANDAWQDTLATAEQVANFGVATLVLDTENSYLRFGHAKELAEALRAEYLPLENLSAESLMLTINAKLN